MHRNTGQETLYMTSHRQYQSWKRVWQQVDSWDDLTTKEGQNWAEYSLVRMWQDLQNDWNKMTFKMSRKGCGLNIFAILSTLGMYVYTESVLRFWGLSWTVTDFHHKWKCKVSSMTSWWIMYPSELYTVHVNYIRMVENMYSPRSVSCRNPSVSVP